MARGAQSLHFTNANLRKINFLSSYFAIQRRNCQQKLDVELLMMSISQNFNWWKNILFINGFFSSRQWGRYSHWFCCSCKSHVSSWPELTQKQSGKKYSRKLVSYVYCKSSIYYVFCLIFYKLVHTIISVIISILNIKHQDLRKVW